MNELKRMPPTGLSILAFGPRSARGWRLQRSYCGEAISVAMDAETLKIHLSAKDFERMTAFMSSMPPERRAEMMTFMAARETLAPAVGSEAPDFELPLLNGDGKVRLSSFRGRKRSR